MRIEDSAVSVFRGENQKVELIARGDPEWLEVARGARGAHNMGRRGWRNNRHPAALTATDTVLGVGNGEIVTLPGRRQKVE